MAITVFDHHKKDDPKGEQKALDAYTVDKGERLQARLGIVDQRNAEAKIPTVKEFWEKTFQSYAESLYIAKTFKGWIRPGLRAVMKYKPLAEQRINLVTITDIVTFRTYRAKSWNCHTHEHGVKPRTVNASLRALRLMLNYAVEAKVIIAAPDFKKKMLPGETTRDRVVSQREWMRYLTVAEERMAQVHTLMMETGVRPDEAHRLRWEQIYWNRGPRGQFTTLLGKSKAAGRTLSLTKRTREILQMRHSEAGKPAKGWIFPADTKSGHVNASTFKRQHDKVFRLIREQSPDDPVEYFVPYSLRHTYLTRLATTPIPTRMPDGSVIGLKIDVHTFKRIAGHSSIEMSLRYVHPEESHIVAAMEGLAELPDVAVTNWPQIPDGTQTM